MIPEKFDEDIPTSMSTQKETVPEKKKRKQNS
jgi:hypothetical protein